MTPFDAVLAQSRVAYHIGTRGGLPGEAFTPHACASLALGAWHRMLAATPDPREDCPWKCPTGHKPCLCAERKP